MAFTEFILCARFWEKDFIYFISFFVTIFQKRKLRFRAIKLEMYTKLKFTEVGISAELKFLIFNSMPFYEKQQCAFNLLNNSFILRILFFIMRIFHLLTKSIC